MYTLYSALCKPYTGIRFIAQAITVRSFSLNAPVDSNF